MNIDNAYIVYLGTVDPSAKSINIRPDDVKDLLDSHKSLTLLSDDIYRTWPLNEHHFTTRFLHKTFLPTVLNLMGEQIPYNRVKWKEETAEGYDISRYVVDESKGKFGVWSLTYKVGLNGNANALQYNQAIIDYRIPSIFDTYSPYHKLYTFPHTCSRITNIGSNNGKKICVSCDSQMISVIPIFASLYEETWVMDQRDPKLSFADELNNVSFDDILIEIGYTGCIDKFTTENFR